MTARSAILACCVTLALGACVDNKTVLTGPEADNLVAQIAKSNIGPGAAPVDGTSAAMIFGDVCAGTAPSFRNAPAVMAKMPFRLHPGTGTYYHQNLDLSIKLMPKQCSMVFGSTDDPNQIGIVMAVSAVSTSGSNEIGITPGTGSAAARGPKGTTFRLQPTGKFKGRMMFRAVLIAP